MPSKDTGILELIQYKKSDKEPFFIYTDLEYIIKQTDVCKNNPENSFTTKLCNQVFQCLQYLRSIENKNEVYRAKDCIKKFC